MKKWRKKKWTWRLLFSLDTPVLLITSLCPSVIDSVYCVCVHPVLENMGASGGGDDKAFVFDLTTGQTIRKLEGY